MTLIADDEPSSRLLLSATIASDAYRLVGAVDGDEAWQLIQEHHPTVALLDIQMPGRTGLDLTRTIKGDSSLADIRVILLTAQAQERDIEAGTAAGADRYLTKSFSLLELLDALEQALEQAKT